MAVLTCVASNAFAQADGAYSPYSIFGVGNINNNSSAYHQSMAGIGIANRNNRYMNLINPAAITARDSLSFMSDFSLRADNRIFRQGDNISANNIVNINNFAISFPLWKNTGMSLGIMPYSDTGFDFSFIYTDNSNILNGQPVFNAEGAGSIYKAFVGGAVTLFRKLSLGAELDIYFGNVEKNFNTTFNDASYNSVTNNTSLQTNALGGKFGLQYEENIGNNLKLTVGATYSTGADMKGYYTDTRLTGTVVTDTLYYKADTLGITKKVRLASEVGVGVSLRNPGKWMAEFNYTRSDWTNSGIEYLSGYSENYNPFRTTVSQAFRAGFEYTPNMNDIRYYFNRATYRVGAYHKNEYYLLNGHQINSTALTFGVTLPVYRWYNGVTLGVELGQRASVSNNLIRERFINFSIGFNIFDIWFQKPRYE